MNRLERLEKILNGGKGSGNFNPGQGRGVGKPSNHSINTDISKSGLTHKPADITAGYTGTTSASIINDLLRQKLDTKDYQDVIDRLDSNMEEIKVDTLLKRGVSFDFLGLNSEAFGITKDMNYKEVQKNIIGKKFKDLGYVSTTYGDESDYGSIHLKIKCPKGTKAIWTGNDKEKEVILSRGTTFKVNDYKRENENNEWSKIIIDLEVISQDSLDKKNNMIKNGGPGSGNFNPGQGRGIGKPNDFYMTTSRRSYCRKGDEVVAQYNKGNNEMGKVQGILDWDSDNKPYITTKEGEKVYLSDLPDYGLKLIRTNEEILNETHKTPKQRRTQKQKEAIDYLDNTVKIGYNTREWLYQYADEDVMVSMAKVIKEAKELGLETNNRIILSKMRSSKSGTRQVWGRAWASGITEFPTKLLDATPWVIQEINKNSDGFHTNDSVEGVIRHEIGHQISYQNALFKLTSVDGYCKSIIEKAVNDITGGKEKDTMNYMKSNRDMMSKYGSKNYSESIAEAWSNPDYSALTKNIAEQLKNDMKEHKDAMNQTIKINKRFEDFPLCSGYGPEFSDEEELKNDKNKIKIKNSRIERLNAILNGGHGSGNFNPGQGRGVGKPNEEYIDYYVTEIPKYFIEWGYADASKAHYFVEENKEVLYENNVKTEKQKEAIADYTRFAFTPINGYLRGDKHSYREEDVDKLKEKIETIDSCFNGSLNKNMITYRAIRFNEDFKKPKVGDVIENKGYSSTSINPESIHESLGRIIMLKVKKGTKALYIDNNTSNISGENELLFPRNMKIKITKDYTGMTAIERVDADVPDGVYYEGILYSDSKKNNNIKFNGGPGSGNFNPGQGRGIGKPNGSSKEIKFSESGIPEVSYEDLEKIKKEYDDLDDNLLLSDRQEKLLKRNYFGTSNYRWVQDYKKALDEEERRDIVETFGEEVEETAEELDYLFEDASLSKDVTLYRGIYSDDKKFETIKSLNRILYGGYSSTSMSPTEAAWKRNSWENDKKNFILLKINAKKGSKGIKNPRLEDNELEVLLPPYARLIKKNVEEIQNGDSKICIIEVDYE